MTWHRSIDWHLVGLCLITAAGVTLLRIGLVETLHVWTEDGRLSVAPWAYALLNGAHIGLTLTLLVALLSPRTRTRKSNPEV